MQRSRFILYDETFSRLIEGLSSVVRFLLAYIQQPLSVQLSSKQISNLWLLCVR